MNGEVSIGTTTLFIIPSNFTTSHPPAATPAPTSPPIKTCVSETGRENTQDVITSKIRAPIKVAIITSPDAILSEIIPLPIVAATADPNIIPKKFPTTDSMTA